MAALESRDFLTSCLRCALEDPDLVDAIAEQASQEGLDAVKIAEGSVSVSALKDLLFLTSDEAQLLYNVCLAMVKEDGATRGNQGAQLSLRLAATSSGKLSVRINLKEQLPKSESVCWACGDPQAVPAALVPPPMSGEHLDAPVVEEPVMNIFVQDAPAANVPVPGTTTLAVPVIAVPAPEARLGRAPYRLDESATEAPAATDVELEQPVASPVASLQASVVGGDMQVEPLPEVMDSAAVVVVSRSSPAPSSKKLEAVTSAQPSPAPAPSRLAPASAESAWLQTPSSIPRPPKPSPTRPKSAIPKPSTLTLPPESSAPALLGSTSPALSSSSCSTPSYLRPTAAHKARTAKESPVSLAPVPEEKKLSRHRSLFERVASTLLAPTQAFVARITGRAEEANAKKQSPVTKASLQLSAMLNSPSGQRVTKPRPFALNSDTRSRSASCVLTTEELSMAEAREKAWKRAPVPKHVHESRPIVPTVRSEPKKPETIFKPFHLASVELHNKKMEEKRKAEEAAAKAEEEARQFHARAFDARIAAGPISPRKPAASPPTRGVAPVFASEARIAHYHEVVEPVKKAKEAEANTEKLEAERKAKELEELSVQEFRKTLEFKARKMPDFSAPFRPDPAQARPVTASVEFQLHTDKRLGAAPSPGAREDKEGPGLGHGVYDGAGYVDPFFASLRKSTSVAIGRGTAGSSMTVRRSAAVRQSAAAAYGRSTGVGGSPGVRGSVGTALQAAIRAAARDAARELEAREAAVSPGGCGASTRRNKGGDGVASPSVAVAK